VTEEQGWRVGHQGRDQMYYEERHAGEWWRLEIQGEMLMGPAHHVIYFDSPAAWQQYPAWARHRRAEIIARIMTVFRSPDYEYHGASAPAATPVDKATRNGESSHHPRWAPSNSALSSATPKQLRALLVAIALVLMISAGMGWVVVRGVVSGTSNMPAKRPSQMRTVMRVREPVMYWTSIGVYAVLGLTTFGLGLWGMREWTTMQRSLHTDR
jgi:hypothetical protein